MSSTQIDGTLAPRIGFASHQNAVPVVRDLRVAHGGDDDLHDLRLELTSQPSFLAPKTWHIDTLRAGATLHIDDRDLALDAGYLAGLDESVRGDVTLRLWQGDVLLAERGHAIELLAPRHWGGAGSMPDLLAAFVQPNDPAIDRVLRAASDVLRRAGRPDGLDGYQGQSRQRVWELASALWSAVCGAGLRYVLPPASFEDVGQKVRAPGAVMEGGVATCLDTAVLFAAALEQAGLNPLVVFTRGHAFTGVWLQPQEFAQLITDDAAAVRKRVDLKEMLVFETTLATQSPPASFDDAIAEGERQLLDDERFIMAVDIRRARMQRIRPLALQTDAAPAGADAAVPSAGEAFSPAPSLPAFDVDTASDIDTPAGRLAAWQRKLLDLTTRNRLLHLPDTAKVVRLLCPDPTALEDRLADGKKVRIVPLPDLELGGRDAELYAQQNREDLRLAYARTALERGEAVSAQDKDKLEAALIELYRKARSDLDEGGANTLFLALGVLKWKKAADDPRTYSAPLILLPVRLERKSALSGLTLSLLEDEPRFNLTLLELLRHDFELSIPGLEGELPRDGNGIDVEGIWNTVRRAVRDAAGFEVVPDVVLGNFSFAKYLMWKDLSDRVGDLMQSPLVKYLLERSPDSPGYPVRGEFPRADELDHRVDPAELFTPLPADSSQLAAVVASASGSDFVLDGPPGTGKSQTIANMIAHNLALGRRVLFVAEKMAALDVVYRRLEEKGLGAFCLELHSSKTSKVEVLRQLERAWDTRESLSAEAWQREATQVRELRDRLNGVVDALHRRWPNGWTVYQAIGRVLHDARPDLPRPDWKPCRPVQEGGVPLVHDTAAMARLRDVVRRLDLNAQTAHALSADFAAVQRSDWSNAWQEDTVVAAQALVVAIDTLVAALLTLREAAQLPVADATTAEQTHALLALVGALRAAHGVDLRFGFAPDASTRIETARQAIAHVQKYRDIETSLSLPYAAQACRRIDPDAVHTAWTAASGRFWFFATLAKKKVARQLAEQGGVTGLPDVAADLPRLRKLRALAAEIDGMQPLLAGMPGFDGLDTDGDRLEAALALAERMRGCLPALVSTPESLIALRRAVATLVVDANDLLAPGGRVAQAGDAAVQAWQGFDAASDRFATAIGAEPADTFEAWQALARKVSARAPQLKAWIDWCRVRTDARTVGLGALADALVAGTLGGPAADAFETAYARWFATGAIDADPVLRHFVAAEHMSDIEAFRHLDDRMAELSVRYIRARLCGEIPSKQDIGKHGGYGVLKHELQKQRRHKPVRQLAAEMGDAMTHLAPCMLMSPLSIAQFLPPDQGLFDLVIFDEASQITPWDAIGAIARGRQAIVAGDPRQMPPTNFFDRGASAADDDVEEDMESILTECLAAAVPSHSLNWHYRSRHESLIAFSNHRYYDSKLVTFPAPETRPSAVGWRRIQGVYAKGAARNNPIEAQALVDEAVSRLRDPAFNASGLSLGIITLNSEQQQLVSDLLDRARQQHPEIEPHFQDERREPVVVKNLETVQGDERDLILLGIGYGPSAPDDNSMSMNFGPLNKEGGWRRLNVAVTRARREMLVFSSFEPGMIDLNRTGARAVRDLKHFIEFAQRGPRALAEAVQGSVGGYDSPFEEAVADGLRAKGWEVVPQIGVSRFRIDLGIVHPDRPGDYLCGVECDGATYHSAATARDRDKVRAGVLNGLGWTLLRVWSTQWWVDREGALATLHTDIEALLAASRAAHGGASSPYGNTGQEQVVSASDD